MTKNWLTASELAALNPPVLRKTERAFQVAAKREGCNRAPRHIVTVR
jgi:hypothetical protein